MIAKDITKHDIEFLAELKLQLASEIGNKYVETMNKIDKALKDFKVEEILLHSIGIICFILQERYKVQ